MQIHRQFPKTFLVAVVFDKVVGYIVCRMETSVFNTQKAKNKKQPQQNKTITRRLYLQVYRSFRKAFLVALFVDKVICYITSKMDMSKKGHIVALAVMPNHRRKNIGKSLVTKALKGISEYGANETYLEVKVNNKHAIDFYRSMGFTQSKRIIGYYTDGTDAYLMTKKMTA